MLDLEISDRAINGNHPVDGYTNEQVSYHLAQIIESGLAVGDARYSIGNQNPTIPAVVMVTRLTASGHDFIESVRNDNVWKKIKSKIADVGGDVSIDLIKELGKSYTKLLLDIPS